MSAELLKCSQRSDDAQRLACFDALASTVTARIDDGVSKREVEAAARDDHSDSEDQSQSEAASDQQRPNNAPDMAAQTSTSQMSATQGATHGLAAMSAAEVRAAQVAQFGANQLDRDKRPTTRAVDPIDEMEAVVVRVDENPYGKLTIWLDNGQVWRQSGSDRFGLRESRDLSVPIKISRSLFGGYRVERLDAHHRMTARRIR